MKRLVRLTENDLHRIVKESVNRILNEAMPSKVANKKDAIDYINWVFDVCEELKEMGSNRLSVGNIYPYEQVYRKYYSKWVDATNHNYPRKRDLLLDLMNDHMVYRMLNFQEIESIFNSRYGE
jgi:hypothetical protein